MAYSLLTKEEKETYIGRLNNQNMTKPSQQILKEFDLDKDRGDKFLFKCSELLDTCRDNQPTGYWQFDLYIWSRNK